MLADLTALITQEERPLEYRSLHGSVVIFLLLRR